MPKLTQEQISAAKQQNAERGINDDAPKELVPLPVDQGQAYVYKLVACTAAPSKSSGRPQWTWEFQLDGRYHPEFVGNGYLEKIWHYTAADAGNEWGITKMFHHFGYSNDTDTDELINEEATVLVYPVVDMYQGKPKMKARRFAYHDEADYPQAKSPLEQEAEEKMAAYATQQGVSQGPEHPASVANPEGNYQVPQDDPWATSAPAASATPAVPPQAQSNEDDTF